MNFFKNKKSKDSPTEEYYVKTGIKNESIVNVENSESSFVFPHLEHTFIIYDLVETLGIEPQAYSFSDCRAITIDTKSPYLTYLHLYLHHLP